MTTPSKFSVTLPTSVFLSENYEQSWLKLQAVLTDISLKVNMREVAFYNLLETPTGQQWFKNATLAVPRQALRQVYTFGAIAAGAALNIPMNITGFATLTFTHMYGSFKTVVPDDRPLPYADEAVVTNQVSLKRAGANIVIMNGATAPNITSGIVVLEYLKN